MASVLSGIGHDLSVEPSGAQANTAQANIALPRRDPPGSGSGQGQGQGRGEGEGEGEGEVEGGDEGEGQGQGRGRGQGRGQAQDRVASRLGFGFISVLLP